KSKKALSPVVASIILIAVTVAVSIAVAAWMGALTIGFMGSASVTITKVAFPQGTSGGQFTITVKNTGTKQVTIDLIKVNNLEKQFSPDPTTLNPGTNSTITITCDWVSGNPYKIELYDSSGQVVGSTQVTAPGA
ncbi:MAG: archaellin/type IV pilin N-terminal domain-containing protein, partial [Candidatus Bathyarchaeia archaeon]